MQFLKPSAIFFASIAVAVAEHQHGMQHFHRRQMNSTSSDISTTLTVYQTVVHTITSCAPTITNCPARSSAGAGVITDVIVLTTTICPVSAAESVASSIISAAGGSSNAFTGTPASSTLNTPLGTGLAGGGGQGVSGTSGGIGDSSASGTILTYMLGAGSSTTIATTTLKHTSTATAYVTQYVTRSHSAAAIATGGAAVTQGGAPGTQIGAAVTQTGATGAASQAEQTTTITSSSTMTEYITVMLAPSSSGLPANGVTGGSSTGGNGIGSGNGGESGIGSGSCDCATVAPVTVTVALATVTVTYSPMAASPSAPPSPATSAGSIEVAAASSLTASPSTTAEVMSSFAASSLLANSTAPYGNGTVTVTKPCYGSATGFLTLAKPTETISAY